MSSLSILNIKDKKNDNNNTKWVLNLFKLEPFRPGYIPVRDIRILKELTRYQYKHINIRSSEKNRFQNVLTVRNCKIDMVFSDVFDKFISIIDDYTSEDILSKVDERCKASHEDILSAIERTSLTVHQNLHALC